MSHATPSATGATNPPAAPDDHIVIAEIKRGNREMFEVLVRRYNQPLFRVGMAYLRRAEQVEDAMQNTYLKAYLNLGRYLGAAAFSTWLTRIMINECLQTLRRRSRSREIEKPTDEHPATEPSIDSAHAAKTLSLKEMKLLLEQAVAELPRPCRVVYILREVQHLDTRATAAALKITSGSVRIRLHRARDLLKTRLLASAAGVELFTYGSAHCRNLTARVMAIILRTA